MPRCLQSVASHFTPAGRIEPVVIVLAAVSILLGQTLEPIEEWTSNKLLTKGRTVDEKTPRINMTSRFSPGFKHTSSERRIMPRETFYKLIYYKRTLLVNICIKT